MPSKYYEGEDFQNLTLTEARLEGLTLVDCSFTGCVFERCQLVRCALTECRFTRCRVIDPKSESSQVKFLSLQDCALTGVNWSLLLPAGSFGEPLDKLEACRMKYNFFTEMDLRRFSFEGSSLTECMFTGCNLSESRFSGCSLAGTEFFQCSLTCADLRGAQGYRIDVPSCQLKGARLAMPEAVSLLYSLGVRLE